MTHPLKQWLRVQQPRKTLKAFAAEIGVHDITLRRMMAADDSTTRETFERVERGTNGELTAIYLYRFYQDQRRTAGDLAEAS